MKLRELVYLISALVLGLECTPCFGQTSELFMLYSPNVIYPVGTTSVYQGGHRLRSWAHSTPYEIALTAAGGSVRQSAVFGGFTGSEYTPAGVPTGTHYPATPYVFDAASDGTYLYGWQLETATLVRYDLNFSHPQSLFSLGASFSYAFMGITFDPRNNSVWLSPWGNTGAWDPKGYLYNYGLDGNLLGRLSLSDSESRGAGLAFDAADNTLWFFNWTDQRYEQYSSNGVLLTTLTGMTRIYGAEFAVVPEPSCTLLLGTAGLLLILRRRRHNC